MQVYMRRGILRIGIILLLFIAQGCVTTQPGAPAGAPAETQPSHSAETEATVGTPTLAETPALIPSETSVATLTVIPNPANWITPTLTTLSMVDPENGWGLTQGQVVRTTDGGGRWLNVSPEGGFGEGAYLSGYFLDASTAWVLPSSPASTDTGRLYRSQDGGRTWQDSEVPFAGGQLQFLDTRAGWALVGRGAAAGSSAVDIYRTADGGVSWERVYSIDPQKAAEPGQLPFAGQKTGLAFRDNLHGWVGGEEPMDGYVWLFATQDGGSTWQHQDLALPPGYEQSMTSVDPPRFFSPQAGILPVRLFTQVSARVFYESRDGGATWVAGKPVDNAGLYDCVSMQDCWVWDGVRMDVTQDGGETWKTVNPNLNLSQVIAQLDFVSPTDGWVTSQDANGKGALYRTMDGGATWSSLVP